MPAPNQKGPIAMIVDIHNFPGVIEAINKLLSTDRVVEVRMDMKVPDGISVSEHARYLEGVYTTDGRVKK